MTCILEGNYCGAWGAQNGLKVRWTRERMVILGTGAHSCSVWLPGAELGQVGASGCKIIQLDTRKKFLSLRSGLDGVSSPVIIQLERGS